MKFNWKDKEFYIHQTLAFELDTIVYNLKKDWDVVILISGDRMVRVGKSVLAMTICAYLAWALSKVKIKGEVMNVDGYKIDDIYFESENMIKKIDKKPTYSINHYDEGREALAASKSMKTFQQDLLDYFNDCGQLNHLFVVVCPDFFELKEYMAVGRSEFLLNVYRREVNVMIDLYGDGVKRPLERWDRGGFEFFDRKRKSWLFDKAKSSKKKSYQAVRANFIGDFTHQYTVDETEYRKRKREALTASKEKSKKKDTMNQEVRRKLVVYHKNKGLTTKEIIDLFEEMDIKGYSEQHINRIYKESKENKENA